MSARQEAESPVPWLEQKQWPHAASVHRTDQMGSSPETARCPVDAEPYPGVHGSVQPVRQSFPTQRLLHPKQYLSLRKAG